MPENPVTSRLLPTRSRIFVAGHRGMVGSALVRHLRSEGYQNLVVRTRAELDLTEQQTVQQFFQDTPIDAVILAAAKVGGIHANYTWPAEFIYQNLMIQANVIHGAFRAGIQRLLFLGSSCIYPKFAPQPMPEECLLSDYLEPTNEPYAVAKIAGIKLCEYYNRQYGTHYRSVMPTNLYGPDDNFDLQSAHVLAAMLRKFHLAKLAQRNDWPAIERDQNRFGPIPDTMRGHLTALSKMDRTRSIPQNAGVPLWGTGAPKREFLHVDDLARACAFLFNLADDSYQKSLAIDEDQRLVGIKEREKVSHINIGSGAEISTKELADEVAAVVDYRGPILWDASKPDGTPRKLLNTRRLNRLGWQPDIPLKDGLHQTYQWYLSQLEAQ